MHSMVARATEPSRSASSWCAEPKMRRKSLVRKLPSLCAAIAVIVFIDVLRMIVDRFETHTIAIYRPIRSFLYFPGVGESGLLGLAFRHHESGQGVFRKFVQDVAVGPLGRRKIASFEFLRSMPGHRAQRLVPVANFQVRIVADAKRQQFIDHELGFAAFDLNAP